MPQIARSMGVRIDFMSLFIGHRHLFCHGMMNQNDFHFECCLLEDSCSHSQMPFKSKMVQLQIDMIISAIKYCKISTKWLIKMKIEAMVCKICVRFGSILEIGMVHTLDNHLLRSIV